MRKRKIGRRERKMRRKRMRKRNEKMTTFKYCEYKRMGKSPGED